MVNDTDFLCWVQLPGVEPVHHVAQPLQVPEHLSEDRDVRPVQTDTVFLLRLWAAPGTTWYCCRLTVSEDRNLSYPSWMDSGRSW